MTNLPSSLEFQGQSLPVVNHNNQVWLTSQSIAIALGYSKSNSVTRIYNRNKDEFTSSMCQEVNLTPRDGNRWKTRIFSPRGCHLIAMLAKTEKAKLFRKWVLDVLEAIQAANNQVDSNLLQAVLNAAMSQSGRYVATDKLLLANTVRWMDAVKTHLSEGVALLDTAMAHINHSAQQDLTRFGRVNG